MAHSEYVHGQANVSAHMQLTASLQCLWSDKGHVTLSPRLSCLSHAMLKSWVEPGDKATLRCCRFQYCWLALGLFCPMHFFQHDLRYDSSDFRLCNKQWCKKGPSCLESTSLQCLSRNSIWPPLWFHHTPEPQRRKSLICSRWACNLPHKWMLFYPLS